MDLPDNDLIRQLQERDGPLPARSWPHSTEGDCRYSEMYEGQQCPWCAAEERRRQRETTVQASG